MKNILKPIVFVMAVCLLAFSACKKKVDTSTQSRMAGKWKVMKIATDANNNGLIDADESIDMTDSLNMNLTFNSGGTGVLEVSILVFTQKDDFTWTLQNNNADVNIKPTSAASSTIGEVTFHIEALTITDAIFSGTDVTGGSTEKSWLFLKKQ